MRPEELDDVFGGLVLRRRADSFLHELAVLKRHPHKDSIHDTRVQSRRMRAALEAFQSLIPPDVWKAVYDSVRGITKNLGRVREAEVSLSLLEDLTAGADVLEKICADYLVERLRGKFTKLQRQLKKNLKKIDVRDLRSRIKTLLTGLGQANAPEATRGIIAPIRPGRSLRGSGRQASRAAQPFLFALHGETIGRARKLLSELAAPLIAFRPRPDFRRATDARLHRLRISAKKLRYAMEIFDEIWPGGLKEAIEHARALQDAGGRYQDWAVMCGRLHKEIQRLRRHSLLNLSLQMERILADGEGRKTELRKDILPALTRFQTSLRELVQNPPLEERADSDAKEAAGQL